MDLHSIHANTLHSLSLSFLLEVVLQPPARLQSRLNAGLREGRREVLTDVSGFPFTIILESPLQVALLKQQKEQTLKEKDIARKGLGKLIN